jgi:hypothetical protein
MAATPCEYISWNQFYSLCVKLHQRIIDSGFQPDIIVAIGRGGYMPGRILSDFFALLDLATFKIEHYHQASRQATAVVKYPLGADLTDKRVLLVDDVSDSGDTFVVALQHLRQHGEPAQLRTATLHHKVVSTYAPDFYARRILKWRWLAYPWAVAEDVTSFLDQAPQWPASAEEAAAYLKQTHGLHLPRSVLNQVWPILTGNRTVSIKPMLPG